MIKIEGVTFIVSEIKKMEKDEFINNHINVLWTDRKLEDREKMLEDAYELINK